ncbi:hypothetical protein L6164_007970 [Bauhinia variegata]|uniref:Uncharacterized protein n=1 Tax=Bauhinia variegata TaxID=167791 RepID=A0ACB9PE82_BAUVA|nr:hypothetical protein L6164_007970 [Bauhinia variegata]
MLLRTSISGTKKFFKRTLENLKSFFSGVNYERLPKAKTCTESKFSSSVAATSVMGMNRNQPSFNELEKFYAEFSSQWDSTEKDKARSRSKKNTVSLSSPRKEEEKEVSIKFSPLQKKNDHKEEAEESGKQKKKSSITLQRVMQKDSTLREERNGVLEQKLRKLEMLDMGNVDYLLDIQEVLHYYSRLTCPAYLEIVEKFFMEVCSEFLGSARPVTATPPSVNCKLKLRSTRS